MTNQILLTLINSGLRVLIGFLCLKLIGIYGEPKNIIQFGQIQSVLNILTTVCQFGLGYGILTIFKDPIVKVNILNFKVSILGEVNTPGEYNIIRSNQNILHLIGKSNDLTEFANRKKIKVIRRNEVESRVIYLDLTDPRLLNNKDIYLHPQDIVYVEPLKKKFYSVKNLSSAVSIGISAITLYFLLLNNS